MTAQKAGSVLILQVIKGGMGKVGAETGALALDLYSGHQAKVLLEDHLPTSAGGYFF